MANTLSKTVTDDQLNAIIQIESAGNPNAKAKTSSAAGLGQFIDSTWTLLLQKHRPELLKGRSSGEVRALKYDPKLNLEMLARFTEFNLAALGPKAASGDLYLAHFLGLDAAKDVLNANPATPVEKVVSQAAVKANPSILKNQTCAGVRSWANKKMSQPHSDWVSKFYKG